MKRLLAVVLAAFVLFPAAAAEARVKRGFWGVHFGFHKALSPGSDLKRMANGRVGAVRWSLSWPRIEPEKGRFEWGNADDVIGDLASRGIAVLPIAIGSPRWAVPNNNPPNILCPIFGCTTPPVTPPTSPSAREHWARFLRLAVKRYGPGGKYWSGRYRQQHPGASPKPIRLWEIWNEVNIAHAWPPQPSPSQYADLLKLSHNVITKVHPRATIALAGLPGRVSFHGWDYLDQLYDVPRIKRFFDLVAVHPYDSNIDRVRDQMKRFRGVMRQHGDRRTGVWVSEIGWGSAARDGRLNVGHAGQAARLSKAFRLLRAERKHWHIKRVTWFDWRDPENYDGGCTWCGYAGLVGPGGHAKPSWGAYKRATKRRHR
jgi:hypothetical protein